MYNEMLMVIFICVVRFVFETYFTRSSAWLHKNFSHNHLLLLLLFFKQATLLGTFLYEMQSTAEDSIILSVLSTSFQDI